MKSPSQKLIVCVRLPKDMVIELRQQAASDCRSLSSLIALLLKRGLEQRRAV